MARCKSSDPLVCSGRVPAEKSSLRHLSRVRSRMLETLNVDPKVGMSDPDGEVFVLSVALAVLRPWLPLSSASVVPVFCVHSVAGTLWHLRRCVYSGQCRRSRDVPAVWVCSHVPAAIGCTDVPQNFRPCKLPGARLRWGAGQSLVRGGVGASGPCMTLQGGVRRWPQPRIPLLPVACADQNSAKLPRALVL